MINVLLILEIILPFVITVDIAVDIAFALLKELYLNRHNSRHLKHLVTAPSPLQHLDYGMIYLKKFGKAVTLTFLRDHLRVTFLK